MTVDIQKGTVIHIPKILRSRSWAIFPIRSSEHHVPFIHLKQEEQLGPLKILGFWAFLKLQGALATCGWMDMEVQVRRVKDAGPKSVAGFEAKLRPIPDALLRSAWKPEATRRKMEAPKNKGPVIQDEASTDARWPHLRQASPEPWHQRRKKQHEWESWQKVAELAGLRFRLT